MHLVFSPFACCSALQLPCTRETLDRTLSIQHHLRLEKPQASAASDYLSNERSIPTSTCQCTGLHASTPQHAHMPLIIPYKLCRVAPNGSESPPGKSSGMSKITRANLANLHFSSSVVRIAVPITEIVRAKAVDIGTSLTVPRFDCFQSLSNAQQDDIGTSQPGVPPSHSDYRWTGWVDNV